METVIENSLKLLISILQFRKAIIVTFVELNRCTNLPKPFEKYALKIADGVPNFFLAGYNRLKSDNSKRSICTFKNGWNTFIIIMNCYPINSVYLIKRVIGNLHTYTYYICKYTPIYEFEKKHR